MLILKADQQAILKASKVVAEGGIVVYPTDTVYGVGCDPFNENSVRRLIEAKQRRKNPLPVLGSSMRNVERIAWFNEKASILASKFWPGPLTLILERKPALPDLVTFGLPTVGVRVPNCDVALRLIELSGGLLVGTSANLSGNKSCPSAWEAADQIGDKVDLILDGGETVLKKESTVARVDNEMHVLRYGAISESEIISTFS
jgi:L-threonylcarbamoyladenylate synthase